MSGDDPGRRYVVVSSDSHAGADLLDYKPYLERRYHQEFDAWAADFHDAWSAIDTEMVDTEDENLRVGVASFLSPYNWDNDKRVAHMDSEGVAAEVLFPNTVPPFYPSGAIGAPPPLDAAGYELRWAGVKAHNRWLVDFCHALPGRRIGLAQVFLNDIDDAIAEVRWAREAGLAGVLLPSDHYRMLVNLFGPELDPFWAACCELDLPLHRHGSVIADAETPETGPAESAVGIYEGAWFGRRALAQLTIGGVFHRHPTLKFVFTENGCAWVPPELSRLDQWWRRGVTKGTATYTFAHRSLETQTLLPSEYFARNCYLGASLMTTPDVETRHLLGADRIMWGSDYPHHEGTWPHTDVALRLNFSAVPEPEVRQMTSLSAAAVYGLDLGFLQGVADRVGPTPAQVARPVAEHEIPRPSMTRTFDPETLRFKL